MEELNIVMNVNEEQSRLFMKIEGRLDTKTAPELEEKVNQKTEKVSSIIMDFTELEYISSAGLRGGDLGTLLRWENLLPGVR